MTAQPVAMTVAGSDPSGGAGLQADLKTFHSLGVHGESAVTILTDCAADGVLRVSATEPAFVARQIRRVCRDFPPHAVKSGMLFSRPIVNVLARHLAAVPDQAFVFDPVITTRRGETLVADDALHAMQTGLVPRATLVTPSMPEAAVLTGLPVKDHDDMEKAGHRLVEQGANAVLLTGGHLDDAESADFLVGRDIQPRWLAGRRIPSVLHGAGDCISAAVTAGLASGRDLEAAVDAAKQVVDRAVANAQPSDRDHCAIVRFIPGA
ncbi:bifunctional hydroxymethylpyrimidine kinase/phosphomethylpyrimidine kinase [Salinisphaera orenii]|uniref:bifunctional hydroxymethylpyrimidine kinase/phosphomethylpyrimidine kinase n=1 Tax=Salinisphaera orenii TaxID=856731 RepID=UPI000DBEA185